MGILLLQNSIGCLLANDSTGAAHTHPLLSKASSSESQVSHGGQDGTVSSLSLSALMSSPVTCRSSGGRMHRAKSRPKRRAGQFDDDQENIDPAAVYDSSTASDQSVKPVSKKRCSMETDSSVKIHNGRKVESSDTEGNRVHGEGYTSLVSRVAVSSQSCNSRASSDVTIKSVLNHSDDKLHELIGDFSRPYCLPFTENDKHRDLKAITCHTVSCGPFCFHFRSH